MRRLLFHGTAGSRPLHGLFFLLVLSMKFFHVAYHLVSLRNYLPCGIDLGLLFQEISLNLLSPRIQIELFHRRTFLDLNSPLNFFHGMPLGFSQVISAGTAHAPYPRGILALITDRSQKGNVGI